VVEVTNNLEDLPEGDGVLIISPQRQILSGSLQAERLLGRKLSHGHTLPLENLFHHEYLPQAESALREALEVGRSSSNFTGQIKLASGLTVFLNYSITPL
jgi:hypothetical protein